MSTVTKPLALDETLEGVKNAILSLPGGGTVATVASDLADPYDNTASYAVGDLCVKDNVLKKCNTAITTGGETWNAAHWDDTTVDAELGNLKSAIQILEPDATSSDVGKFLKAKTVSGGKVTEYEFGEGGSASGETLLAQVVVTGDTANVVSFDYTNNTVTLDATGMATTGGQYNFGAFVKPKEGVVWGKFDICPAAIRCKKLQLRVTEDPYTYKLTTDGTNEYDIVEDSAVDATKLVIVKQHANPAITSIPTGRKLRVRTLTQFTVDNASVKIYRAGGSSSYGNSEDKSAWRPFNYKSDYELLSTRSYYVQSVRFPYTCFDVIITPTSDRIYYESVCYGAFLNTNGTIQPWEFRQRAASVNDGIAKLEAAPGNYMAGVPGDYIELYDLGAV